MMYEGRSRDLLSVTSSQSPPPRTSVEDDVVGDDDDNNSFSSSISSSIISNNNTEEAGNAGVVSGISSGLLPSRQHTTKIMNRDDRNANSKSPPRIPRRSISHEEISKALLPRRTMTTPVSSSSKQGQQQQLLYSTTSEKANHDIPEKQPDKTTRMMTVNHASLLGVVRQNHRRDKSPTTTTTSSHPRRRVRRTTSSSTNRRTVEVVGRSSRARRLSPLATNRRQHHRRTFSDKRQVPGRSSSAPMEIQVDCDHLDSSNNNIHPKQQPMTQRQPVMRGGSSGARRRGSMPRMPSRKISNDHGSASSFKTTSSVDSLSTVTTAAAGTIAAGKPQYHGSSSSNLSTNTTDEVLDLIQSQVAYFSEGVVNFLIAKVMRDSKMDQDTSDALSSCTTTFLLSSEEMSEESTEDEEEAAATTAVTTTPRTVAVAKKDEMKDDESLRINPTASAHKNEMKDDESLRINPASAHKNEMKDDESLRINVAVAAHKNEMKDDESLRISQLHLQDSIGSSFMTRGMDSSFTSMSESSEKRRDHHFAMNAFPHHALLGARLDDDDCDDSDDDIGNGNRMLYDAMGLYGDDNRRVRFGGSRSGHTSTSSALPLQYEESHNDSLDDSFCSFSSNEIIRDTSEQNSKRQRHRETRMVKALEDLGRHANQQRLTTTTTTTAKQHTLSPHHSIPPSSTCQCSLLFVDISGFTVLSTKLGIQQLSKTINSYFQIIVQQIIEFGGDVVRFAGDALFAVWHTSTFQSLEDENQKQLLATQTACACAAKISEKCADFTVLDEFKQFVATLNVRCGVGFGEITSIHAGDRSRREFFIVGQPVKQATEALSSGDQGDVVASPEVLDLLHLSKQHPDLIIFSKNRPELNVDWDLTHILSHASRPKKSLQDQIEEWDLPMLLKLQKLIERYMHPVAADWCGDTFSMNSSVSGYRGKRTHVADAEIRDVYTVFVQPLITTPDAGTPDEQTLKTLNAIMILGNREVVRFKGQLRQFIVDDKGVVLIANFGLRGSTFPNMAERKVLPFIACIQSVFKAKLAIDCRVGATYGKAYCGTIGGIARNEYSILGPSVNLAARLMGSPMNNGFLVDEALKQRAPSREFQVLEPVKAKGYAKKVPIFEPVPAVEPFKKDNSDFVGRADELDAIMDVAMELLDIGAPSKLVLVTGNSGIGKSSLLSKAVHNIQDMCEELRLSRLLLGHVCAGENHFQPLSVVGRLLLDVIGKDRKDKHEQDIKRANAAGVDRYWVHKFGNDKKSLSRLAVGQLLGAFRDVDAPEQEIWTIVSLILSYDFREDELSNVQERLAAFIAMVFLKCMINFDVTVLAIDDMNHMDELSWKVIELLYSHGCNLMICGTMQITQCSDTGMDQGFWDSLFDEESNDTNFTCVELCPMDQKDVNRFVAHYIEENSNFRQSVSHDVFTQTGGMPQLVSVMTRRRASMDHRGFSVDASPEQKSEEKYEEDNLGEHVNNRMDTLPAAVRTDLQMCAMLGDSFNVGDLIRVMELYREVSEEDKVDHAESVQESISEALWSGILEENDSPVPNAEDSCSQPYLQQYMNEYYKFTHEVWKVNILKLTLDDWKEDVQELIDQALGGSSQTS